MKSIKGTTLIFLGVVVTWMGFLIFDDTPPPVIDQILVITFGGWFTHAMIDKKDKEIKKTSESTEKSSS